MIKCNLAVLMAERKLSIQDVADRTKLSRTTISALVNENGKGIQFETMDALCELLEVSPGELFSHAAIKTDFSFELGTPSSTVVQDEEENLVAYNTTYHAVVKVDISADQHLFEQSIIGDLRISQSKTSQVWAAGLQITSPGEFSEFLADRPFHVREFIEKRFEEALMDLVKTIPGVKEIQTSKVVIKFPRSQRK